MLILRFVLPAVTLLLIVVGLLWLDQRTGWHGVRIVWLGAPVAIAGQLLMVWCIGMLLLKGRGTPHPFVAKTKHLVHSGPYAVVRNPMVWGAGLSVVGYCLWFGLAGLWVGFICLLLFVHWFVPLYEEPDMERRFGEEYRDYCRRVPRWFPRQRHHGKSRLHTA